MGRWGQVVASKPAFTRAHGYSSAHGGPHTRANREVARTAAKASVERPSVRVLPLAVDDLDLTPRFFDEVRCLDVVS